MGPWGMGCTCSSDVLGVSRGVLHALAAQGGWRCLCGSLALRLDWPCTAGCLLLGPAAGG